MEKMPLCPVMSAGLFANTNHPIGAPRATGCECVGRACAWWIEAHTVEFPEIRQPVGGCAIAMGPQLNDAGRFRV